MNSINKIKRTTLQIHVEKVIAGCVILLIGSLLIFWNNIFITQPDNYAYNDEPISMEGFRETDNDSETPTRIIIPSVNIDLEVKTAEVINGYWEVFDDKAGWGKGSGIPGKAGNQVIFAHAREGLFEPLKKVKVKDSVYVLSVSDIRENGVDNNYISSEVSTKAWHAYEITSITEVFPNETQVIKPTEDETLTLYTCSGYKDSKRLIVVAKPKK
ncbi:sortase [Candidatus Woesebacteria bacterium]|nr:MAG: sortase [Candidatus Woesebacteria bacterium]